MTQTEFDSIIKTTKLLAPNTYYGLRAIFVDGLPVKEAAQKQGISVASLRWSSTTFQKARDVIAGQHLRAGEAHLVGPEPLLEGVAQLLQFVETLDAARKHRVTRETLGFIENQMGKLK